MYRLLIVDDEQLIVDWLYRLFSGLTHLELDIYKANTGTQAMDLMNRAKIDIVLTDIHMPEMNGLQLLENIRSNWPDCKVIFLTGYNQFDYIYTAIKHEGVSYLLKTEDDLEIINAVEKAVNEIEDSLKNSELIKKARQQVSMALPLMQKEFLTAFLLGEKLEFSVTQQQLDELEMPLRFDRPLHLLLGRIDNLSKKLTRLDKTRLIYTAKLAVEQCLLLHVKAANIIFEDSYSVWFTQPVNPDEAWERTAMFVREMLETAQRVCLESLNVSLSFALSNDRDSWDTVSDRYQELKQLLNYRAGVEHGMIVTGKDSGLVVQDEPYNKSQAGGNKKLLVNRVSLMESYLELGRRQDFFELFTEIGEFLRNTHSMHFIPALEVYFSLSLKLLSYIGQRGISGKMAFRTSIHKLTCIDEFDSWSDAAEYLRQCADTVFELQESEQEKRSIDVIAQVKQFILEHLSEEISLIRLGELLYLNPSYLSRLFKQMTGSNISDYIQNARINKSKELLGRNGMKIHEIAAAVGLESPAYFAKFFRKAVNMTPQEYRDSLIKL